MSSLLLGIDAGGTKTEAFFVSLQDGAHFSALGSGSNPQGAGMDGARAVWSDLVQRGLAHFATDVSAIAAAGLGIAGLDRPRDEAAMRPVFDALLPRLPYTLVNDAYLALRAGTPDGVGIAVVSGTGANAMGMNAAGKRFRIGGFGPDFGDLGGGTDIGIEALRKAFRSLDGRDQPTLLADLIRQRLRLERLDDLLDLLEPGHGRGFSPALLAPIVFEAAAHWDRAALSILEGAGRELGIAARAVARELFSPDERFVLVMGGSVLQKGKVPVMRDRLRAEVAAEFPHAQPRVLDWKPVAGAVLYALDQVLAAGLADDDACELVRRTLAGCLRCRIGEGTA